MVRFLRVLLLLLVFNTTSYSQDIDTSWVRSVGVQKWKHGNRTILVDASGDIKDTGNYATTAIQHAIDICSAKGGGIVYFRPGVYVTGAIFLKSDVVLCIDKGVVLLASQEFKDYPKMKSRIAGIEMEWPSAVINIIGQKNTGIAGKGKIDARGSFCWNKYWKMRKDYDKRGLRWVVDYDAERIRTILVQHCSNILLKDVQLSNAGFWTVQLLYSDHITVDGLMIKNNEDGHGPSTDGIDIDSSEFILVDNCDIDCNDDNICLKSGRDWDGLRINKPTQYVVIRNCIARRGAGLLTLGSETSGGIKHVYAYHLKAANTDNAFRIKSAKTRGGILEDILVRDWTLDSIKTIFQFNLNWYPTYSYSGLPKGYTEAIMPEHWKIMLRKVEPASIGIPKVNGIVIMDIHATHSDKLLDVFGLEEAPIEKVRIVHSDFGINDIGTMHYYKDWKWVQVDMAMFYSNDRKTVYSKEDLERLK